MTENNCLPAGLLRFGTREFFEEAASLAVHLAEGIRKSNVKLLWLVVLSHNMLQNAMAIVLRRSANIGALDEKSQQDRIKWLNEFRAGNDAAEPERLSRLADFKTLVKRVRDSQSICPPLQLNQQQLKDLDSLNKFRNDFIHVIDSFRTVHVDDLRQPILAALQVTGEIIQHPQCWRWTRDECFRDRVKGFLMKIRNHIESMDEC